jgi:hypothetical protein
MFAGSLQAATVVTVSPFTGLSDDIVDGIQIASNALTTTVDGASFNFNLQIAGTNFVDNPVLNETAQRLLMNDSNTAVSETVIFSLVNVTETTSTGRTLVLDGITDLTVSNFLTKHTKSFLAGGTTYTAADDGLTGDDSDATWTITLDSLVADSTITATGGDNFRINGVTLQLSSVPEPSAAALIGLAGLALILRRRR